MTQLNAFASVAEMGRALRRHELSARELLRAQIRRIEQHDRALNSVVVGDFERALRDAAVADERLVQGDESQLLGIPVTIKESVDVEGLPSTAGVPHRRGHFASSDARTVARLRAAGAVILGKTNVCTWLADFNADNPVYGRTNNPWNRARTSGGSSAGSASLAAGLCAIDLGSDLGGSLRVPAAFCGVYGHRPSETAVPNSGHFPGSPLPNAAAFMAIQGPQARTAEDIELALDAIAGPDVGMDVGWSLRLPPARHERLTDFRVAVLPPVPWLPVQPEVRAAQEQLCKEIARRGALVQTTTVPGVEPAESYALFRSMMGAMVSPRWPAELREQVVARKLASGERFQAAEAQGLKATGADYLNWHERREALRDVWRDFFRRFDVLLTPATLTTAFEHTSVPADQRKLIVDGKSIDFDFMSFYTGLSNLPGQPATAFPAALGHDGLPIGMQAIGPFLEDRTPIRFVQQIAQELGGFAAPPGYDDAL